MGVLFFLAVQLTATLWTLYYSGRARLWSTLGVSVAVVYVAVARGLLALPPYVALPGASLIEGHEIVALVVAVVAQGAATWDAWRKSDRLEHGTTGHDLAWRATYGALGCTLLDAILLVIVLLALALAARSGF